MEGGGGETNIHIQSSYRVSTSPPDPGVFEKAWVFNRLLQGVPKRSVDAKVALESAIEEWFSIPPSLFVHAWTSTGYTTREAMLSLNGWTEDDLQEATWICHLCVCVCVVVCVWTRV